MGGGYKYTVCRKVITNKCVVGAFFHRNPAKKPMKNGFVGFKTLDSRTSPNGWKVTKVIGLTAR